MKQINQKIETLIVRSLDGALTEQEQLELNRELIRNPDARQIMEQYQRIDNVAMEALNQVIGQTDFSDIIIETNQPVYRTRKIQRSWLLIPGAIAAALLAIVIPRIDLTNSTKPGPPLVTNRQTAIPINEIQPATNWNIGQNEMVQPVSYPRTRRNTGREMFGVMGDDGKIYWIEVDRIRTIRQNRPMNGSPYWNEM